ncbi:DAL1_1 [Blepharisma stoltei]|uniref:Amidohydrolase-related domain-containing protein n=1 Tax=Blepharisma stoltei TaxID=1481888 RepID=A0AAU9KAA5_9CILI|nr:unnamed protein product [Blepharisma stoltei]
MAENDLHNQPILKAICSNNVVLEGRSKTIPAAILIKDEYIVEIIELLDTSQIPEIMPSYSEYTWISYGDLYISPGIIDLNACFNEEVSSELEGDALDSENPVNPSMIEDWEGYESGTKASISGGVTTVIESPSLARSTLTTLNDYLMKLNNLSNINLYCDIGFLAFIDPNSLSEISNLSRSGIVGFKVYMIPPFGDLKYFTTENLPLLFQEVSQYPKPLFIHPEKTSERFLYMSSPFRQYGLDRRKIRTMPAALLFAASLPEESSPTSSDSSSSSSSSSSGEGELEEKKKFEGKIKKESENFECLIKAEINTYSHSGNTIYNSEVKNPQETPEIPKFSINQTNFNNFRSPDFEQNFLKPTQIKPVNPELRRNSWRPPPIDCEKIEHPDQADYRVFLSNSPQQWETNGIQSVLSELKNFPNVKVHISSVSSANAVYAVRKAKLECPELSLTCETCGIYIHFSMNHIRDGDTRFKAHPPIREEKNRQLILDLLRMGSIDTVTSYHQPVKPALKNISNGDFQKAVSGVSSIGLTLQCCYGAIRNDPREDAVKLAQILSMKPAEIAGIEKVKGSIAVGKFADFFVWNPYETDVQNCQYMRHPSVSPFVGERLAGKVLVTYLRGKIAYREGEFFANGRAL